MFTLVQSGREYYYKNKELFTHIISIVCPDDDLTPLHDNHMVVKFWDVDHEMVNKFRRYTVVDSVTVMDPILRAGKWYLHANEKDEPIRLLVHCDMGMSRSSAVALGVLWHISNYLFRGDPGAEEILLKSWIQARKDWCYNHIDDQCTGLKRYVDGRMNPGVRPNQAVLKHYRDCIAYFPW